LRKQGPLAANTAGDRYDAIYLDLAIRRSLPLATLDDDLRKTAKKMSVGALG
jgi:predicted nucleic acid-binding protein